MGIIGLEKYIDSNKNGLIKNDVIVNRPIGELIDKLVVDGNQLPYIILDTLKPSLYSGNYDQMYEFSLSFLKRLKPYIHIVIFDGINEDFNKSKKKFAERVCKFMNIGVDHFKKAIDLRTHFNVLKTSRNLFYRLVFYEVLNKLDIKYTMAEGKNTQLLASYANGNNDFNKTFTILSKDSYFNMIELVDGYISWKYAVETLTKYDDLNETTKLEVFNLKKLLQFYGICHKTWIYFGLLNGDYDLNLTRNNKYLQLINIDTKVRDYNVDLIFHMKSNESKYVIDNYYEIRKTYNKENLAKVDKLIEKFEMKNNSQPVIDHKYLDDFEKTIEIINTLNVNYLNCLIEDPNESTCYSVVQKNEILNMIYYLLTTTNNLNNVTTINEYFRNHNGTTFDNCVLVKPVKIEKPQNILIFNYLSKQNESLLNNNLSQNDNEICLLMTSMVVWHEWLSNHDYKNSVDIPADTFIESIITNLMIIDLKKILLTFSDNNDEKSISLNNSISELKMNAVEINELNRITKIYDQLINSNDNNLNEMEFFTNHVKIVHRLNEFQSIFYSICLLSKVSQFKLKYLSPGNFFNGKFLFEYINKKQTDAIQIIKESIDKIETFKAARQNLKNKFNMHHKNLYSNQIENISSVLETLKLE